MERTKFVLAAVAIFAIGLAISPAIMSQLTATSVMSSPEKIMSDSLKFSNPILVYKNGVLVATGENAVTNIMKNYTSSVLGGFRLNSTPIINLELSTESSAVNATVATCGAPVTTGGMTINEGTKAQYVNTIANYSVQYTWTATGTVSDITKVCLGNTTTSGMANLLFASAVFSPTVSVAAGDQLTVNYSIAVS